MPGIRKRRAVLLASLEKAREAKRLKRMMTGEAAPDVVEEVAPPASPPQEANYPVNENVDKEEVAPPASPPQEANYPVVENVDKEEEEVAPPASPSTVVVQNEEDTVAPPASPSTVVVQNEEETVTPSRTVEEQEIGQALLDLLSSTPVPTPATTQTQPPKITDDDMYDALSICMTLVAPMPQEEQPKDWFPWTGNVVDRMLERGSSV